MKVNLTALLALLVLTCAHAFAQTTTHAQIYFLNSAPGHIISLISPQTISNGEKTIAIPFRTCALIDLATDSLSINVNGGIQPIYFAPGKTYYFIGYSDYNSSVQITEVTERTFWLSSAINKSKSIARYNINKLIN